MSNLDDPSTYAVKVADHISTANSIGAENPVASAICAQAEALMAVAAAVERLTDRLGEIR